MKDYHYILGVNKNATKQEIQKAFRKLSIKFHPDKNEGDKFFEDRFKDINEAYAFLMGDKVNYQNNNNQSKSNNFVPDPEILRFDVNMSKIFEGDTLILSWQTRSCTNVELVGIGKVEFNGIKKISFQNIKTPETKTYELIVRNSNGIIKKKSLQVLVKPKIVITNKKRLSKLSEYKNIIYITSLIILLILTILVYLNEKKHELQKGLIAYDNNIYELAFSKFIKNKDKLTPYMQYLLGYLYNQGLGTTRDYNEALTWYKNSATHGLANAQYNIGVLYHNGQGVTQDYNEAMNWYQKASDQELPAAQCNIGVLYNNGQGVSQDFGEAFRWYKKAAIQGFPEAQYNLGILYNYGRGISQDFNEAMIWYQKASDQGYYPATIEIERLNLLPIETITSKFELPLPNLVCMTYSAANLLLSSLGLITLEWEENVIEDKNASFITYQDPLFNPNFKIKKGDTLRIFLNSQKPEYCPN